MPATDPYKKYREQSVNTMTPGELIVLLYEEAAMSINKAKNYISKNDTCEAHNSIIKAENIFLYLMDSLDMNYPISQNLLLLYDYLYNRLVTANLEKNADILQEVLSKTVELKDTWKQAEINNREHLKGKTV